MLHLFAVQCICAPSRSARKINHELAQNLCIYIILANTKADSSKAAAIQETAADIQDWSAAQSWVTETSR